MALLPVLLSKPEIKAIYPHEEAKNAVYDIYIYNIKRKEAVKSENYIRIDSNKTYLST